MGIVSPLPEPDKGGFLNTIRGAADSLWQNLQRAIKTPFGQETVSPIPDSERNIIRVNFNKPNPPIVVDNTKQSISLPSLRPATQPMATSTPRPTSSVPMPTPTLRPDIPAHSYTPIIQKYFPKNELNNAQNVIMGESSFNPFNVNSNNDGSKDYGLFQINDIHAADIKDRFGWSMTDLFDPEKNIRVASWLFKRQGWKPWVAARSLGLVQ